MLDQLENNQILYWLFCFMLAIPFAGFALAFLAYISSRGGLTNGVAFVFVYSGYVFFLLSFLVSIICIIRSGVASFRHSKLIIKGQPMESFAMALGSGAGCFIITGAVNAGYISKAFVGWLH